MNFRLFFANPVVKTIATNLVGVLAVGIDSAVSSPSGGSLAYLQSHPSVSIVYLIAQQLTHNFLSKYAPPSTVMTVPPAEQVSTPQAPTPH